MMCRLAAGCDEIHFSFTAGKKGKINMGKTKKKKADSESFFKVLIFCLIVMVFMLILLIIFRVFNAGRISEEIEKNGVVRNLVVIDENAVVPEYDEKTVNSASQYDVKMNTNWTFADGRSYSEDAYVENPVSNINDVYFDVTVAGYSGKVFTSPVIPVAGHLENITFDKVLPAGSYNGILTYYLLGTDGETSVGNLQVALRILVQK